MFFMVIMHYDLVFCHVFMVIMHYDLVFLWSLCTMI